MRYAIFAVLVVAPIALISWIVWRGQTEKPEYVVGSGVSGKGSESPTPGSKPDESATDDTLLGLFADPIVGVKVDGEVALFDEKGLFDYINGAAPVFIERSFRKLAAAEMVTADGGNITCDVYDMKAAVNATSIFDTERSAKAQEVPSWPEAIISARAFAFHHGRFYVKLTAYDRGAEALLPEFAAVLRDRMKPADEAAPKTDND